MYNTMCKSWKVVNDSVLRIPLCIAKRELKQWDVHLEKIFQDIPERVNQRKAQSTKTVMITLIMPVYTPPFIIMEEYCL